MKSFAQWTANFFFLNRQWTKRLPNSVLNAEPPTPPNDPMTSIKRPIKSRQSMFVKHVPPLWTYFIDMIEGNKIVRQTFQESPAIFDEHELFPHMHF